MTVSIPENWGHFWLIGRLGRDIISQCSMWRGRAAAPNCWSMPLVLTSSWASWKSRPKTTLSTLTKTSMWVASWRRYSSLTHSPLVHPSKSIYCEVSYLIGVISLVSFWWDLVSLCVWKFLTGNEARHFTVIDADASAASAAAALEPAPIVYNYTTLSVDGSSLSFVECDTLAEVIPDGESLSRSSVVRGRQLSMWCGKTGFICKPNVCVFIC